MIGDEEATLVNDIKENLFYAQMLSPYRKTFYNMKYIFSSSSRFIVKNRLISMHNSFLKKIYIIFARDHQMIKNLCCLLHSIKNNNIK